MKSSVMKRTILAIGLAAACTAAFLWFRLGETADSERDPAKSAPASRQMVPDVSDRPAPSEEASLSGTEELEPKTEEEKAAEAEESLVNAFDALTDGWMEPRKGEVTMKDIDAFVAAFRKVPKDRQDECIHRAQNLIPDENVMLLAGILLDKSMDKEIVETVFHDILNRGDAVKTPILRQLHKDRSHPCWADTAWILDVTGE